MVILRHPRSSSHFFFVVMEQANQGGPARCPRRSVLPRHRRQGLGRCGVDAAAASRFKEPNPTEGGQGKPNRRKGAAGKGGRTNRGSTAARPIPTDLFNGETESCTSPIGWKRAVVCIESKPAKRLPQRLSVLITLARARVRRMSCLHLPSAPPDHAHLRSVILCQSSLHMNSFVFASCQRFISVYVPSSSRVARTSYHFKPSLPPYMP